jgi:hypothetical protein
MTRSNRGWKRPFEDPIPLPGGRKLVTLKDAATYITNLPKREHDAPKWQAATQALLLVAENDGPTMMAHIGMMQALYPGDVMPTPRRKKAAKKYRIVR